jgi:hypothetical protein
MTLIRKPLVTEATAFVLTIRSADHTKDHTEVTTTMQRKTRRIIAAVAVIALLAAGGAAFTASIQGLDGNNANIGFGAETVTGATANTVSYSLSADGQYVDQVAVDLSGDYHTGYTFNGRLTGASGALEQIGVCTAGSYNSGTPGDTPMTCDFTGSTGSGGGYQAAGGGAAGTGVAVDTVQGFELSVTGNNSSGTSSNFNGS